MHSKSTGQVGVVLVAAGFGLRYSSAVGTPKQFAELGGKPLYRWALERFCASERIDQIVVATREELIADTRAHIKDLMDRKPIHVIAGGATRQLSVYNGLETLQALFPRHDEATLAMVHDAARPFVTIELINSVLEAASLYGACTAAIPVTDTIKKLSGSVIVETLDRQQLAQVQTPQAARLDWLIEAHRHAIKDGITTTDDAAILEKSGRTVHTIIGSMFNIKVTTAQDMELAKILSQSQLINVS